MKKIRRAVRNGRRLQRAARAGIVTAHSNTSLARAAAHVVAKRTAIGFAAMADPAQADRAELARIVPEKTTAFGASAMILMRCSGEVAQEAARFTTSEAALATRAATDLASCRTPEAAAAIQSRFVTGWFNRAFAQSIVVGTLAMRSYGAIMAPVLQTAIRNSRRLA